MARRRGRDGGDRGKGSRCYRCAVKRGDEASIAKIAAHIGRHRDNNGIHGVLGEDVDTVVTSGATMLAAISAVFDAIA